MRKFTKRERLEATKDPVKVAVLVRGNEIRTVLSDDLSVAATIIHLPADGTYEPEKIIEAAGMAKWPYRIFDWQENPTLVKHLADAQPEQKPIPLGTVIDVNGKYIVKTRHESWCVDGWLHFDNLLDAATFAVTGRQEDQDKATIVFSSGLKTFIKNSIADAVKSRRVGIR